jgi:hypothetical protein
MAILFPQNKILTPLYPPKSCDGIIIPLFRSQNLGTIQNANQINNDARRGWPMIWWIQ